MCYTCGCGHLDDDMGDPRNITNKTFEQAAKADNESVEDAKRHTFEALEKSLKEKK